ncbi:hypothetical protein SCUCBS95973_001317 [Sporothrix curviconia]|uniref:Uncharacterized protein n=1 Tax=Sporothrix curviconia TaxID=1260050 RepID=A0ABP0AY06_9PEZI
MDVDGDPASKPADTQASSPLPQHPTTTLPHEVTLVAAAELHEKQRWQPTALHPGTAFKMVEWSADGTAVIASTASKSILTYVLPADLLSRDEEDDDDTDGKRHCRPRHRTLTCHGRLQFGIAPASLAPAPYFSLAAPWSQTILVGFRDRPIQLYPLFPPERQENGGGDGDDDDDGVMPPKAPQPLASYSLIKHETEAYLPPMALLWPAPGNHFIVGTKSLLALFDSSRTSNDPPLLRVPTITYTGGGFALGLKGMVSALAAGTEGSSQHLTAAGTWTRGVGLYDLTRAGGSCAAHWKVSDDAASAVSRGDGIVQLLWSHCGRYLVVNERKSQGLLVYDVRGASKLLCTLAGRSARSTQPVRCSVYGGSHHQKGFELWSGTDSGGVVVYEGVGQHEGVVDPSWQWQAHGQTVVGGTAMHASGSVVATCSSSLPVVDRDDDDDDGDGEASESGSRDGNKTDDSDSESESNSESESSTCSSSASRRGRPRNTISDPSISIWSLLSLKAGKE